MPRNCPKCHCGCLFEDHGKLVCLNCGTECRPAETRGVRHIHSYTTYTGSASGKARKVPKQQPAPKPQAARPAAQAAKAHEDGVPASARTYQRPAAPAPQRTMPQRKQKKSSFRPLLVVFLIIVALNILPLIGSAIQGAVYHINSRIETSVPEEPATPVGDSEDYAFGVLYWYAEDPVSDETADALDDIVLDYNLDHDLPDMESASDYLLPLLEDLPISDWSLEQEDNDICLLVTPE